MWEFSESLGPHTARDVFQLCFADTALWRLYHAGEGHGNVQMSALPDGRETTFSTGGVAGFGEMHVHERMEWQLSADQRHLSVESRSTLQGGGPAARLHPLTRWAVDDDAGTVSMRLEAIFMPAGYADRLLASTVQSTALAKGREAMTRWWTEAKRILDASLEERQKERQKEEAKEEAKERRKEEEEEEESKDEHGDDEENESVVSVASFCV